MAHITDLAITILTFGWVTAYIRLRRAKRELAEYAFGVQDWARAKLGGADSGRKPPTDRIISLVASGHAGVLPNGNTVDRREHPEAVPMQESALLGIPPPIDRGKS